MKVSMFCLSQPSSVDQLVNEFLESLESERIRVIDIKISANQDGCYILVMYE